MDVANRRTGDGLSHSLMRCYVEDGESGDCSTALVERLKCCWSLFGHVRCEYYFNSPAAGFNVVIYGTWRYGVRSDDICEPFNYLYPWFPRIWTFLVTFKQARISCRRSILLITMKTSSAITLGLTALVGSAAASPVDLEERASTVKGFDISSYQPNVDFAKAYAGGARFVIIKVRSLTDIPSIQHYHHAS